MILDLSECIMGACMFEKVLFPGWAMLIYLDIKIPHQGGNLEVGNIKIHPYILLFCPISIIIRH